MASNFKAEFEGLAELKERLSQKTLDERLIVAVGIAALEFHNFLNTRVKDIYATNRSLNSVLLTKTNSATKRGTGVIESGLEYKFEPINLGKFPQHSSFMGNINSWATKEGKVQQVAVKRANGKKIIYGKLHYGGFRQKGLIFERSQRETWIVKGVRAPIHQLYGPSLTQMANTTFLTDSKTQMYKSKLPDIIIKNLAL